MDSLSAGVRILCVRSIYMWYANAYTFGVYGTNAAYTVAGSNIIATYGHRRPGEALDIWVRFDYTCAGISLCGAMVA